MYSFHTKAKFYPDEHFPYGIGRSGDFNSKQATLLELHGKAYEALHSGVRKPANKEEVRFEEVCRGEKDAETEHEKAWLRYCQIIEKKTTISTLGAGSMMRPRL